MYKPVGEKLVSELMTNHEIESQNIIENYSNVALKRAIQVCKSNFKRLKESQNVEFDEEIEDIILKLQKCSELIKKEILKRNNKESESWSLTPKVAAKHELERAIKLANKAEREENETFKKGKKYRIKTWDELLEDDKNSIDATGDITNNENGAWFVKSMKKISNTIFEADENKERFLVLGWQVEPCMCEKVESITLEETSKLERTVREVENPNVEYVSADLESIEPEEKGTGTVNHPQHYNVGSIETIDVIEGLGWGQGFNLGNALKYLMRCEHKGKKKEDLEKAMWYIKRELENIEEEK